MKKADAKGVLHLKAGVLNARPFDLRPMSRHVSSEDQWEFYDVLCRDAGACLLGGDRVCVSWW